MLSLPQSLRAQIAAAIPVAALTVHRTVIHSRDTATLTLVRGSLKKAPTTIGKQFDKSQFIELFEIIKLWENDAKKTIRTKVVRVRRTAGRGPGEGGFSSGAKGNDTTVVTNR